MTEIELNRQLEELEVAKCDQIGVALRRTGSAYRRMMKRQKQERLYKIVTGSYIPHAGYVDWDFVNGELRPVGKYIKYPKKQ